jgi:hypothetical protein
MSEALATTQVRPFDPSLLGFPPLLPIELAMRVAPVQEICAAYNISKDQFIELSQDPLFVKAYSDAKEALQKDGMSFRIKARLQAEELLKKSWAMIHSPETPTTVKADLLKATVRWAGLEPKADTGTGGMAGNAFQININLG